MRKLVVIKCILLPSYNVVKGFSYERRLGASFKIFDTPQIIQSNLSKYVYKQAI